MSLVTAELPSDPQALRAFALACQAELANKAEELASTAAELKAAKQAIQVTRLEIEKLKLQIAKLRRMQFGRSSERISRKIAQLELQLEELQADEAQSQAAIDAQSTPPAPQEVRAKPKRKPLPECSATRGMAGQRHEGWPVAARRDSALGDAARQPFCVAERQVPFLVW